MTIIALDVMSGDLGAQECVPAALLALSGDAELQQKAYEATHQWNICRK